ncbi:DUF4432 family protein [Paenibacillus antri]|uniref:DUF4432 family protein n=1 Tax=Paenibacillus antri TaxID=2582848 RepID=A0A5R9G8Q8_9BACL|nr:DUF4432 family protein [Paenibacillus antri]TLS52792.1 DUF4432 family protein [Paenibacillus antri]
MSSNLFNEHGLRDKIIDMRQLCGIKEYTLENGPSEGVKVAEFYNGSGLTFSVLKNRGLDIADTFFKGIPLHFRSFGGITAPSESYSRGSEFLRSFYGGLLVTCGVTYTGRPNVDAGEELSLHGRFSNLRATVNRVCGGEWKAGRYELEIEGEVRETALFGPNVSLRRLIRTSLGSPTIELKDIFTNHHNVVTPHAMLYHFTFGYPLVDEGAKLIYRATTVSGLSDNVRNHHAEDMRRIPAPLEIHDGASQDFLYIDVKENEDGLAQVGIVNRKLGLGVKLEYPKAALPRLGNWLHFGHGEYVTAFEPMNGGVEGRSKDRELGWLEEIAPGETKEYTLRFTVLTTPEELDYFESDAPD